MATIDRKLMQGIIAMVTVLMAHAQSLTYRITEEQSRGTFVGNVKQDADLSGISAEDLRRIRFRFLLPDQEYFLVEDSTGIIKTAQKLDRDTICPGEEECQIRADVAIQHAQLFKIISVAVDVEDINDIEPRFTQSSVQLDILESTLPGTNFPLPSAEDGDSPDNGVKEFELVSGENVFDLIVGDGVDGGKDLGLQLAQKLDREVRSSYNLQVVVSDGGNPAKSGRLDIDITVLDTNDNNPVFDRSEYEINMEENTRIGTSIIQVHAEDQDIGLNGEVIYNFSRRTKQNHGSKFRINNATGEIFVSGDIDYEEMAVYHLGVMAWDRGADSIPGTANVIVRVTDMNDHSPDITVTTLSGTDVATTTEGFSNGTFVAHLYVIDLDTGDAGIFECSLNDPLFRLVPMMEIGQYQIVTAAVLDREREDLYSLTVQCRDQGDKPRVSMKHIRVNVLDVNDNAPVFSQNAYRASIIENSYVGAFVTSVSAIDNDLGENATVTYTLRGPDAENFTVDPKTGAVHASESLDRESHAELDFSVVATDGGQPALNSSALVHVTIQDVNDERPTFHPDTYSFSLIEHSEIGSTVGDVTAEDKDGSPYNEFMYSILPSHSTALGLFQIDRYTGRITVRRKLDRETQSSYYLVVKAADRGDPPLSSTVSVSIYIMDINDHAPKFDFPRDDNNTVFISNRVPSGYLVSRVRAHDLDLGNNATISYFLLRGDPESYFEVDETLGTILVRRKMSHIQHKIFNLTIEARDHANIPLSTMARLAIMVNSSIPLTYHGAGGAKGEGGGGKLSEQNMLIVIILSSVSGVITIILVVAIIVIRRQDRNKPSARYNCRMEAMRVVASSKQQQLDQHAAEICLGNGKTASLGRGGKEVSFNTLGEGCQEISGRSWPSSIDANSFQHPQACSSILTRHGMSPSGPPPAYQPRSQRPPPQGAPVRGRPLSPREMEVHQLLQLLKRDSDTVSAHSAEDSATDSGRGHSEEGETNVRVPANGGSAPSTNGSNSPVPQYPQHQSLVPRDVSCGNHSNSLSNQVVPNATGCSSPSYSFHGPHVLQTFASPQSTKERHAGRNDETPIHCNSSCEENAPFDEGFIHTTPAKVLAVDPESCFNNHRNYRANVTKDLQGSLHSYHSNGDDGDEICGEYDTTEMSDGGLLYSCADMTGDVLAKSVTMTVGQHEEDLDTSTSGSYLVDANDLCEEIDELFFKDMGL